MKKIFLTILLLHVIGIQSQKLASISKKGRVVDSLKNVLSTSKSDSLKCVINFRLAQVYGNRADLALRKKYMQDANNLIGGNGYLSDISYYFKTVDYYIRKDFVGYKKALIIANNKLSKYKRKEIYNYRSSMFFNLALCYQIENNTSEAIKTLIDKAIPTNKLANDNEGLANVYRFLGTLFYNNNELEKAAYYLNLSVEKIESEPNKSENYKENLLEIYLFYVQILTSQKKFNIASDYLDKAYKILKEYPNSNINIDYFFAKGTFYLDSKKYSQAIMNFDKGIEKAKLIADQYSITRFKLLKFEGLNGLEKFEQSKNLLNETLNSNYLPIEDKKNYSKELAQVYTKLNDLKNSVKYYEQYIHLNDSLNADSQKNEINALEAKYDNAEKESKIKHLKIQNDKVKLIANNYRMRHITFASIFIVLVILLFVIVANLKNKNKLAKAIEIKNKQEIDILKNQKEVEIMQAMINGEEAERKRIARDLHDGIGSRLSALKMKLQSITENETLKILELLDTLSISIIELRQIAFNLMPETLIKLGIQDAMTDLCHSLSNDRVSISFHGNEISATINSRDQITIFRIVQELVNNALKHANCSEIMVDCSQNNDLFLITVEDNGIGFNVSDLNHFDGLGLKNIKNRIELLNGTMEVSSAPNRGTVFNIELLINQ